jgi:hypothetical protein
MQKTKQSGAPRSFLLAALIVPVVLVGCGHPAYYAPPPPRPPSPYAEIARHGFQDGVQAAQRDIRAGRPPDFARHPRFRNPPVPPPALEDYRRGFRDGYAQVMRSVGPPPRY